MEFDTQVGIVRRDVPWRLVVPDFEVDVGLFTWLELDFDGSLAIEGPDDGSFTFKHAALDNMWVAAKLGKSYYDSLGGATSGWALGAQLGPKLPLARDSHGVGCEGLLLFGRVEGKSHIDLNLGGLVDPRSEISRERPIGIEGGIDGQLDLGLWGLERLSVTGEVGATGYFSSDPAELHVTAGPTWSVVPERLDISVVGLLGFLPGGDHAGVLLGISPKLWPSDCDHKNGFR